MKRITKKQREEIISLISKDSPYFYWDYNSYLSKEDCFKILEGNFIDVENELYENNIDIIFDIENDCIKDAVNSVLGDGEFEKDKDSYRDEFIDFVSFDFDFKQLLSNTSDVRSRVVMKSNYECMPSAWCTTSHGGGYEYSCYFKQVIDILNLNPQLVKKELNKSNHKTVGAFPNKVNRNGKEYVSYSDFVQELENTMSEGIRLNFMGLVDLCDMKSVEGKKGFQAQIDFINKL